MKKHLISEMQRLFFNKSEIIELLNKLTSNYDAFLFGGFLRNYLDDELESFRDIDIVIDSRGQKTSL